VRIVHARVATLGSSHLHTLRAWLPNFAPPPATASLTTFGNDRNLTVSAEPNLSAEVQNRRRITPG